MRKLFCLLFVILLVGSFCIPAFAAGTGWTLYAPLHFDNLYTGTDWVVQSAWQGNTVGSGTWILDENYLSYSLSGSYNSSSGVADLSVYSAASIMFSSGDQVVSSSKLPSFYVYFGADDDGAGTIDYSFSVVTMEVVDDVWTETTIPFSGTFTVGLGEKFALGDKLLREIRREYSGAYIRIDRLSLILTYDPTLLTEDVTPSYRFVFTPSSGSPSNYRSLWLKQYTMDRYVNMSAQLGDADFLGWLSDSANGFLSTPIFGDFSLGGMIAAVISIGLVVALIKLFS